MITCTSWFTRALLFSIVVNYASGRDTFSFVKLRARVGIEENLNYRPHSTEKRNDKSGREVINTISNGDLDNAVTTVSYSESVDNTITDQQQETTRSLQSQEDTLVNELHVDIHSSSTQPLSYERPKTSSDLLDKTILPSESVTSPTPTYPTLMEQLSSTPSQDLTSTTTAKTLKSEDYRTTVVFVVSTSQEHFTETVLQKPQTSITDELQPTHRSGEIEEKASIIENRESEEVLSTTVEVPEEEIVDDSQKISDHADVTKVGKSSKESTTVQTSPEQRGKPMTRAKLRTPDKIGTSYEVLGWDPEGKRGDTQIYALEKVKVLKTLDGKREKLKEKKKKMEAIVEQSELESPENTKLTESQEAEIPEDLRGESELEYYLKFDKGESRTEETTAVTGNSLKTSLVHTEEPSPVSEEHAISQGKAGDEKTGNILREEIDGIGSDEYIKYDEMEMETEEKVHQFEETLTNLEDEEDSLKTEVSDAVLPVPPESTTKMTLKKEKVVPTFKVKVHFENSDSKKVPEQQMEQSEETGSTDSRSENELDSDEYKATDEQEKKTAKKVEELEKEMKKGTKQDKETEQIADNTTTTPPEPSTFMYEALELDLRGPTFELKKSFGSMLLKNRKYRPRTIEHADLDQALLESELMSYQVQEGETERLRELLADPLQLEEDKGETHRDYGSSFIVPVLSAVSYDNSTVPLIFSDIPVNVRVQLNIIHLANFDSEQMEYTIDLELEMRWYDLRLRNNYSKPILVREKAVLDQIWRPDPYFVNSKYSYFHHVSFPNFRMRITPEGLVTYTMRTTLLPSCQMVFCKYPHDRQNCDLMLSSIAYPRTFVNFSWHSRAVSFKSSVALPELHIMSMHTETCEVEGKLIRSSCLRLLFKLERDGGRFIVEKYVPSTLAMMFAWVAPYVPYNYEDVRIVTPIMVLLALVQMEKDDSSIRTSYLTSMNVWFGVMKAFSVLSLIESLVILAFIKRSRAMEKNASRAVSEIDRERFYLEKKRSLRHATLLDKICRALSPFSFILFFIYYVLFVAQGDDSDCVRRRITYENRM